MCSLDDAFELPVAISGLWTYRLSLGCTHTGSPLGSPKEPWHPEPCLGHVSEYNKHTLGTTPGFVTRAVILNFTVSCVKTARSCFLGL